MQAQSKLLEIVRQVLPNGPGGLNSAAPYGYVFVALRDVPEGGLRAADVLFYAQDKRVRHFRGIRGTAVRLPRSALGYIVNGPDAFAFVEDSWPGPTFGTFARREAQIRAKLHGVWGRYVRAGRTWPDGTSALWLLRPWGVVSKPVRASDDATAVASLLLDIGCRPS